MEIARTDPAWDSLLRVRSSWVLQARPSHNLDSAGPVIGCELSLRVQQERLQTSDVAPRARRRDQGAHTMEVAEGRVDSQPQGRAHASLRSAATR